MINGDASLDQILLALLISVWSVVSFNYLVKDRTLRHVRRLHRGKTNQPDVPVKRSLLIVIAVCVVALVGGIGSYLLATRYVENDPVWEANIRAKCPNFFAEDDHTIEFFYTGQILETFG